LIDAHTQTFFFTGFPGFLGHELIQSLLPGIPDARALCLIQPKYFKAAEKARVELVHRNPSLMGRIDFIEGDITQPNLGIAEFAVDRSKITQFFHLAAVYDLSVKKEVAQKINVEGTINTLRFSEKLENLKHYHYISTCYVSGKSVGTFHETDLDVGQKFNNHYEETKFLAEVEVQKSMKQGLPVTIYRPAIVVGNSQTGETQKFDGPYFVIQWLLRQPKFAFLPTVGNPDAHTLNVVPSDFVVQAITYLSQQKSSLHQTFQLADPKPLTIRKLVAALGIFTERKVIPVPLSLSFAKGALQKIPGVEKWLRIPASTLNYFVHPTEYGTSVTQAALKNTSIRVPPFESYGQKLVDFMKSNPSTRSQAMI
jgi:thioester reductase-like protein